MLDKDVNGAARSIEGGPTEAGSLLVLSAGHGLLVNVATHPPEGGPAETRGLSASSLPRHNHLGEKKVREGRPRA